MKAVELISSYLVFFKKKDHKVIPSVSLVPENDPTVLFTTAGMHPLVPYLLGEPHPLGKRLVSLQRCVRTDDIDQVGDACHHTFFLMLGNWSLGDYFKKEAISWSFEFLTRELEIPVEKLSVSVFGGDSDAPCDKESAEIWERLGIAKERIYYLGKDDNWWGPAGATGPCGPDTEMFYDSGKKSCGKNCQPGCDCGKYIEIWNDVFMEYNKTKEEKYEQLGQKNVDTGMGVERIVAVLSGFDDDYKTELFWPIIEEIERISGKKYEGDKRAFRIISDHIRGVCFMIGDGVEPSNKERGYVLRRLIRRSVFYGRNRLGISEPFIARVAEKAMDIYIELFEELIKTKENILSVLEKEEEKFLLTIKRGHKEIGKQKELSGKTAFYLYESFGFPLELTMEIASERGEKIDKKEFEQEFMKHQELSRISSKGKFSGGLADESKKTTKLHTATHLLHWALRTVLGDNVIQKGSNITVDRLRFDFNYQEKLSSEQISRVEELVNEKINENLAVEMRVMSFSQAKKKRAIAAFGERYPKKVRVYFIGESCEVCGGPHVDFTGCLGKFKIFKEESAGSRVRRIYAKLED